jgi:hypothetical protein
MFAIGLLNAETAVGGRCPAFDGVFMAEPEVIERVGPNKALEVGVPGVAQAMFLGFGARDAPRHTPVEPLAPNEFFARMDESREEIVFAANTSGGDMRAVLLRALDGDFRCVDGRIELRDSSSSSSGDGGKSRTVEDRVLFVDRSGNLVVRYRQQRERRDWLLFHRSDETTVTFRYVRVSR